MGGDIMSVAVKTDLDALRVRAALAWRGLTISQRAAMRRAKPRTRELERREHRLTVEALRSHSLVERVDGVVLLTSLGQFVREVGIAADDAAARRRYAAREATP
jgi:hypothetical protein